MLSSEEKENFLECINYARKEPDYIYTVDDIKDGTPDHKCAVCMYFGDLHTNLGEYNTETGFSVAHVVNGKFTEEMTKVDNVIAYIELGK